MGERRMSNAGVKTLIVIRHGESEWNATARPDREEFYFKQIEQEEHQLAHNNKLLECRLRDARMTAKGRTQCAELKKLWAYLEINKILTPELIVVSPLTRALETASLVFGDSGIPTVVHPGFQEHVVNICDIGRPASALSAEFPSYDFSKIPDAWWNVPVSKETAQSFQHRVQSAQNWLTFDVPQRTIVIVGHGHFLREFLRNTPSDSAYMRNTELRIVELPALMREVVLRMDAAIVTCGIRIQLDGSSTQLLAERVKLATKLFFQNANTNNNNNNSNNNANNNNVNNSIMIVTGGATSREVMTSEASVMKLMAIQQGVPIERVFVEDQAMDTIENAMFVKNILDKTNIRKIFLVTSEYHLQRALLVFQRVFGTKFSISAFGASAAVLPPDELKRIEGNEKRFIASLDDLFRQKQPAAIKLPSPRTATIPRGMAKFEDDGRFKHFPGNTVVCMVPRASKQFQVLVQAQQLIRQSPIAAHYALLPPSSLHMTIHDLHSTTPPGLTTEDKNQYWRESNKQTQLLLGPLLESADWTIFRMNFASMTRNVNLVNLVPATPRVEKALASWRTNLQMRVYSRPMPSDYGFHVTLAYVLDPIQGPEAQEALKTLSAQLTQLFSSAFGELELEPPRLTRFSDMSEFLPLFGHMDTALLLGYDMTSGFTCFSHLYEFATGLELRNCRWSNNWSHFVPFVFDGETYYIAYKQNKGTLHIVNAKTAHTIIDIIMTSTTPGFTHVVYVFRAGEPLAVFYNANTNDLLVLNINLKQSTVSPVITTQLAPGNHTHLIECGGHLLAYSSVTGDMVTFHIESSKRVIPAAYLPLGKGISILSSLSAGFAPENATVGRFFAYTATSGKANVFAFSESGFSSAFEATLDTGLTLVLPARFGDSDYIFTYRGQTGQLEVFRCARGNPPSSSSTFFWVARHTLPLFLSSLIFLDRRAPVPLM